MSNSQLFQPFTLHDLTLPSRVVLAPMTRGVQKWGHAEISLLSAFSAVIVQT